jgi:hypothetical protein
MRKFLLFFFSLLICISVRAAELTGLDILKKSEDNVYAETMVYTGEFSINKGERSFIKTFKGWAVGDEKAFVEFTNREDIGVRYLKIENELWIAEEGDVIKISGHLLKRSIMGSDFSFEDMMESHKLSEIYEVNIEGEEKIRDIDCYILNLESDKEDAPYAKQKIWVGKEDFLPYKYEYYALSGRLMKSAEVLETRTITGKNYPVKVKMRDELRKGSTTVLELKDLKLDVKIPEEIFSRKNLLE